jgi:hypothetical protein
MKGMLYQSQKVEEYHAVEYDRPMNDQLQCERKHCKDFCDGAWYQYSDECGSSDPWVQYNDTETQSPQEKKASGLPPPGDTDFDAQKYKILHRGKCTYCLSCKRGYYNVGCNDWGAGKNHFRGDCKECLTECMVDSDNFLWHPVKLRGCNPTDDDGKQQVRVLDNYKCTLCPTWVQKDEQIYAVLGCGNKKKFGYHEIDTTSVSRYIDKTLGISDVHKLVVQTGSRVLPHNEGVDIKFKAVHYTAPYCPVGYFFDRNNNCDFTSRELELKQEDPTIQLHGTNIYNVLCCTKCVVCDPQSQARVIGRWRRCDGSSRRHRDHRVC